MPDLMKTPSNRRYVINFQQKEPINKYDIWLSMNKHELEGNEILDSELLQDTDLVFKVFMNGKWRPIWGMPLNYEGIIGVMKKKINLVPKFKEGNLAVFKHGNDECDQLIDGGSLVEILEKLIHDGEIIPITRATEGSLGGIKAGIASLEDAQDSIIEAKFKGPEVPHNNNNDKIGLLISDIYKALSVYLQNKTIYFPVPLMSPTVRGGAKSNAINHTPTLVLPVYVDSEEKLQVDGSEIKDFVEHLILTIIGDIDIYEDGEGIDITDNVISLELAETSHIGGIKARPHGIQYYVSTGNPAVEPCIVEENTSVLLIDVLYNNRPIPAKHLAITKSQIYAMLNYQDEYTEPMFRSGFGIQPHAHHDYDSHTGVYDDYYTFDLEHSDPTDWGKYLKIMPDGSGIEWANIPAGTVYPPLAVNTVAGTECVVVAPDKKDGFLRGDGQFVAIPTGSSVSWNEYQLTGTKIADITINGITTNIYAPQSNTYHSGNGIYIDNSNNINIFTNGADANDVLSYNGHGFSWVPQISYTQKPGVIIDNVNHTIGGMITNNTSNYVARATLAFNCTYGTIQNPISGIEAVIDGISEDLLKYSYNEVEIVVTDEVSLNFNVSYQKTYMEGIPIYVLLTVSGKPDAVKVTVSDGDSLGLININEAVTTDYNDNSCLNPDYSKFLVTMQFGIVKIEPLDGTTESNI